MATLIRAKYRCTQLALYSICRTAWANCLEYILLFAAKKAKYNALFVTGKNTSIDAAEALPNEEARNEISEVDRVQLIPLRDDCAQDFVDLKGYIEDAFPKEEWKARFEAAGQTNYERAMKDNWEYVNGMNSDMIQFIADNTAVLTAPGGMPAGFPLQVTTHSDDFADKYDELKIARETAPATGAKLSANNGIYEEMQSMFRDGHRVFRNDAEKQKLFTFSVLKDIVSPPGSASLNVEILFPDNTPGVDLKVTIQSEDGTPLVKQTDIFGKCKYDSIDPDRYNVTVQVPAGFKSVSINKDVDTGVGARLTIKLEAV